MPVLFHGTSSSNIAQIAEQGLQPRSATRAKPNHAATPSHEGRVYLSMAYALRYAEMAAHTQGGDPCIMSVGVELENCLPDEDFLAEVWDNIDGIDDRLGRTMWFRDNVDTLDDLARLTHLSYEHLGCVAHVGAIAPDNIIRTAVIPADDMVQITLREYDPSISVLNYKFLGDRHTATHIRLLHKYGIKHGAPA